MLYEVRYQFGVMITYGNDDIVVLAGKGEDPYQKIKGVDTPYATDSKIAADYIRQIEN